MKSKVLVGLLALFLVVWGVAANSGRNGGCFGESSFNSAEAVEAWVAMWNSYDLDQVDQLFLNCEKGLTYLSSEKEGLITGLEAVRKHHEGFGFVAGGKASDKKLWVKDVNTNSHDGCSIVSGTWYFQSGEKVQKGPFTAVYVEKNRVYRIAHMHFANYSAE